MWNSLADELKLNMINMNSFKSTILSYYFGALEIPYDPELWFSLLISAAISYSFI
jgi:hypothetical protein